MKKLIFIKNTWYLLLCLAWVFLPGCTPKGPRLTSEIAQDNAQIVKDADRYLKEAPVTITAYRAEKSAGGIHDYFSEGSYWWPDPENPTGPYIRKDGNRNPANFRKHIKAMGDLTNWVTTLTAAYLVTGDEKYAHHAISHLQAWFITPATRMNPSLLYGQAITGIVTGRGIGIIDTRKLIDVANSSRLLAQAGVLSGATLAGVKDWFDAYGDWLVKHPYGIDERYNNNNHSTWWGAQVAAYALLAEREDLLDTSRTQFKTQLAIQMAADGSCPDELARTKPFGYSNMNLDGWATFAILASSDQENLWQYQSPHGTLKKAIDFMVPYLKDPASWPYPTALETPLKLKRADYLFFAAIGYHDQAYLRLWQELKKEEATSHTNLLLWQKILSDEK
ncbi:MAG: hypothetical protein DA408_02370 [Bacteroidetes bacterium]|nr:MAG: hypothetical protein C7N36_02920 [Bacteroidota bacterium]PTM14654.1 MAG: hypothetical protein DA408_02370 [Bacteroidota bacterium]